jgi:hypothetical protein
MVTMVLGHPCGVLIARGLAARLAHANHKLQTTGNASCLRKQNEGSGPIECSLFQAMRAFDHMLDGSEIDEIAFRHNPLLEKSAELKNEWTYRIDPGTESVLKEKTK